MSAEDTKFEGVEDEISLLDLLEVLTENLRLLILGSLAAGLVALGIAFLITPTFTARVTFLPPQQQQSTAASMLQSLGALSGLAGAAAGIKNPSDQYLAFLKSNSVAGAMVDRFSLMERYKSIHREDAIKALTEEVTKAKSGKDGIIVLEVDDKDPAFAAQMANAYVEELSKLLDRLAVTEAQQRRVFFSKELEKARDKLAAAEKALRATGVSEGELKTTPGAAVGAVAALSAQVSAKEVQIRSMRGSMTESAPEVKRAVSELYALRSQLKKIEQSAPVDKGDYVSKYREFKYQETLFELMAKQFEIAKLDESREGAVIQVVDRAMPPERKSKPKRALIAVIATLATGFLLVLYVFLRGALARAASDGESAEKLSRIRAGIRRALGRS